MEETVLHPQNPEQMYAQNLILAFDLWDDYGHANVF